MKARLQLKFKIRKSKTFTGVTVEYTEQKK